MKSRNNSSIHNVNWYQISIVYHRVVDNTLVYGADDSSSLPVALVRLSSHSLAKWRHL